MNAGIDSSAPVVFLFSGQGSQAFEMGEELYANDPGFRSRMTRLDELVMDFGGSSVVNALYHAGNSKLQPFDDIRLTHPAIFMVEYALARLLIERGLRPDCVVGASLGECAAAAVAGVMSAEDILLSVLRQARCIAESDICGHMIAVLDRVGVFDETPELGQLSEIVAVNFDSHFVIACRRENFARVQSHLKQRQISFLPLPVRYPFHSSYFEPLREPLLAVLGNLRPVSPSIPLYSCATARPVAAFSSQHIWDVYRGQIAVQKTVRALDADRRWRYVDVGPGGSFANFIKYNLPQSAAQVYSIMSPFGREWGRLEKTLAALGARRES